MSSFELAPLAKIDLRDLIAYVAERNPVAAQEMFASIDAALVALAATGPGLEGREVTLRSGRRCRRWFVAPVVIYYQRTSTGLVVLRIYHHAREPITR